MTAIQSVGAEPAKGLVVLVVNSPPPVTRFATHHRITGCRCRCHRSAAAVTAAT
jgi:hypothetical protein